MRAPDVDRVFNRLCHLTALTRDGQIQAAIDSVVASALSIEADGHFHTAAQVSDAISAYFSLTIANSTVQASIDRLSQSTTLTTDQRTGGLRLAPAERGLIHKRVADANDLEQFVKAEWLASVKSTASDLGSVHHDHLWQALRLYLATVFERHGAETTQLLDPTVSLPDIDGRTLTSLLDAAITQHCDGECVSFATIAISSFFRDMTARRTLYCSQLLDSTFTFFALTTDSATSSYLRSQLRPLDIFLDTNFIFGLLHLHVNQFTEVAEDLINFIRSNSFPFTLYYHQETLHELTRTIEAVTNRLRGAQWPQELSRAALQNGQFTAIELRFHELNSRGTVDVDAYLSQFNDLRVILDDYGVKVFRDTSPLSNDDRQRKYRLIAEYQEFMERRRPNRPKPYQALDHDISVWMTVERRRASGASALSVGAMFLTADYYFRSFDWECLRDQREPGCTIFPVQLLQLLRPFVPATDDFDRRFVEAFAIPEFRVANVYTSGTVSKVLSYLRVYRDIKAETAMSLLANNLLLESVGPLDEHSNGFGAAVDSALAAENSHLLEEREALEQERAGLARRVKEVEAEAAAKSSDLVEVSDRLKSAEVTLSDAQRLAAEAEQRRVEAAGRHSSEVSDLSDRLEATNKRFNDELTGAREVAAADAARTLATAEAKALHREHRLRGYVGVLAVALGWLGIVLVPAVTNWEWLSQHPNRLGLYGCAMAVWLGGWWTAMDWSKDRRALAVVTVVVGAGLVMFQLLGK